MVRYWPSKFRRSSRSAFTLVELLVVITIIAILIGLLLPAVQQAREAARRTQCSNNIKQLALAVHGFHQANDALPFGNEYNSDDKPPSSWVTLILPLIERQAHYDSFDFTQVIGHANNKAALTASVKGLICPSDPMGRQGGLLSARCMCCPAAQYKSMGLWYTACAGPVNTGSTTPCPLCPSGATYCCQGGVYGAPTSGAHQSSDTPGMFARYAIGLKFEHVTDGLSNTLMIGETRPWETIHNSAFAINMSIGVTNVPMNYPIPLTQQPVDGLSDGDLHSRNPHNLTGGYKSYHSGGATFALGDGSVRYLNDSIDYKLYNELGTRAGGESSRVP